MKSEIISLNIAELIVSRDPVVISTVLGSCVSVCLFSRDGSAGGMIHYALPVLPENSPDNPLRYGDSAIPALVDELIYITGKSPAAFLAKLIGGANNIHSVHESHKIGVSNVEVGRRLLSRLKIETVGEEVGGDLGRKVRFNVKTGRLQSAFIGPGFIRSSAKKAV